MYIIGKKNLDDHFTWINSIFSSHLDAANWYSKVFGKVDDIAVHAIDAQNYPLYILSDPNQSELVFSLLTDNISQVEEAIKDINEEDMNQLYCNLYVVETDCTNPVMPEETCIGGRTRHMHVDNAFLEMVSKKGIENCI